MENKLEAVTAVWIFLIVKKGRQSLVFLMFWNPRSGALLESNNKKVPLNLILSSRLATKSSQKLRKYLSVPEWEVGEPSFGKIFKILVKGQQWVEWFTLSAVVFENKWDPCQQLWSVSIHWILCHQTNCEPNFSSMDMFVLCDIHVNMWCKLCMISLLKQFKVGVLNISDLQHAQCSEAEIKNLKIWMRVREAKFWKEDVANIGRFQRLGWSKMDQG